MSLTFKRLLLLSLIFLIGFSAGLVTFRYLSRNATLFDIKESRSVSHLYKHINPLLDCDLADFTLTTDLLLLKKTIRDIIDSQIKSQNVSFVSVYYRELNDGPWIGIHDRELFSPASLIKVPLMIAYYKKADSNPDLLNQTITDNITPDDSDQNIKPSVTLAPHKSYTIDELINRMIIYSDNEAFNLLMANIDNRLVRQVYSDLGVDISKADNDPDGDIVSVRDYASFFRVLYNSTYISKTMSEKALDLLTRVQYDRALRAAVPVDVEIAHKFGEREYLATGEKQLHDCGIVYTSKPYLLCVMTRTQKELNSAADTIKQISAAVYAQVGSN